MKRKINFRVWNENTKKMHSASDLATLGAWIILVSNKSIIGELLQSTNLIDKNGKEIFEGDIIKIHNGNEHTKKEYWFPIFEIKNDGFSFQTNHVGGGKSGDSSMFTLRHYSKSQVEVIGNIYENPKMIKK